MSFHTKLLIPHYDEQTGNTYLDNFSVMFIILNISISHYSIQAFTYLIFITDIY